jgi:hypothetical protein
MLSTLIENRGGITDRSRDQNNWVLFLTYHTFTTAKTLLAVGTWRAIFFCPHCT